MLTDKTARCRKRVVLSNQPDGILVPALMHKRYVPWYVNTCRTQGHTRNRLLVTAVAASQLYMRHIFIMEANESLVYHVGSLITDGTVRGLHDAECSLFHLVERFQCRPCVQNIRYHFLELPQPYAAGHALAACLRMAQLQKCL